MGALRVGGGGGGGGGGSQDRSVGKTPRAVKSRKRMGNLFCAVRKTATL